MRWHALFGLLLAGSVHAANLSVLPVIINLAPGHDREAVTLTNQGDEAVIIQADTVAWTQTNGEDIYQPTDQLLANPPLFTIPPGGTQIIRLGLLEPATGDAETAYRLLLREVPPATPVVVAPAGNQPAPPGSAVRVLLQLRLPVYVAPANVKPDAEWQVRLEAGNTLAIDATNTGNVHLLVTKLAVREGDRFLVSQQASSPIFPGQHRQWRLKLDQPPAAKTVVEITTDRGLQSIPLN